MTDWNLVASSYSTTCEVTEADWEHDGRDDASGTISVRIHFQINGAHGSRVLLLGPADLERT